MSLTLICSKMSSEWQSPNRIRDSSLPRNPTVIVPHGASRPKRKSGVDRESAFSAAQSKRWRRSRVGADNLRRRCPWHKLRPGQLWHFDGLSSKLENGGSTLWTQRTDTCGPKSQCMSTRAHLRCRERHSVCDRLRSGRAAVSMTQATNLGNCDNSAAVRRCVSPSIFARSMRCPCHADGRFRH